jgi:hypothetical protein
MVALDPVRIEVLDTLVAGVTSFAA